MSLSAIFTSNCRRFSDVLLFDVDMMGEGRDAGCLATFASNSLNIERDCFENPGRQVETVS